MASGGAKGPNHVQLDDGVPKYLLDAAAALGTKEWVLNAAGARISNPVVVAYITEIGGRSLSSITTPWCSYFTGAMLERNGLPSTKSGMARSYLKWGTKVEDGDWRQGDVVVFWRGKHDDGVTGHVGFLISQTENHVVILGGNQGDAVSYQTFPKSRILGVRRARPLAASNTVRSGTGAAVVEVARQVIDHSIPDPAPAPISGGDLSAWATLVQLKPFAIGMLSVLVISLILFCVYCRYRDYTEGRNT